MKIPTATIGMRLDAAIQQLDTMSSMQLYALIVGLTIVFATVLLSSASEPEIMPDSELREVNAATAVNHPQNNRRKGHPEPRWHIFRWVNYAAVAVFGWSVADFSLHCTKYLNHSDSSVLLKFLLGWSLCLCYFFGFFGISFVHDTIAVEPEEAAAADTR